MTDADARPVRLAILNDYTVIIEGIAAMFATFPDRFEVVLKGGSPVGLGDEAGGSRPEVDVVLIDPFATREPLELRLPRDPAATSRKYAVLTWHTSESSIAEAFELGFDGYLSKTLTTDALCDAVEAIHRGERVVARDVQTPRPLPDGAWPGQEFGLTARESEILCLIAQGLTNQEITQRAHLGAESLKTHIRSSYQKIGVTRRTQAVVWCLSHGLVADVPFAR